MGLTTPAWCEWLATTYTTCTAMEMESRATFDATAACRACRGAHRRTHGGSHSASIESSALSCPLPSPRTPLMHRKTEGTEERIATVTPIASDRFTHLAQ
jgi:hypothetical protein